MPPVLSVVASESTYGYKITQDVRSVMEVSESTPLPGAAASAEERVPGDLRP